MKRKTAAPTIDFWFDYSCPYAYLAATQIERVATTCSAALTLRPMLLGGVFRARQTPQNLMGTLSPAKAKHNAEDLQRWARLFGVKLTIPHGHPFRTVEALRATIVSGCDPKLMHAFFDVYWTDGLSPSSETGFARAAGHAGYDAHELLEAIDHDSVKAALRDATDEAIALGIFGAPSFIVNGKQLFWGQDRIDFVIEATRNNGDHRDEAHT